MASISQDKAPEGKPGEMMRGMAKSEKRAKVIVSTRCSCHLRFSFGEFPQERVLRRLATSMGLRLGTSAFTWFAVSKVCFPEGVA